MTQSVMQGVHSAYRQSIMPRTKSICRWQQHEGSSGDGWLASLAGWLAASDGNMLHAPYMCWRHAARPLHVLATAEAATTVVVAARHTAARHSGSGGGAAKHATAVPLALFLMEKLIKLVSTNT